MTKQEILSKYQEDTQHSIEALYKEAYTNGYKDANKDKQLDLLNRENVNFSIVNSLGEKDNRLEIFKQQRIERGFDDTELWNLDTTIIKFTLPRLKEFKKRTCGYPSRVKSKEEWDNILQSIIDYMQAVVDNNDELREEYAKGWDNFHEYFSALWW